MKLRIAFQLVILLIVAGAASAQKKAANSSKAVSAKTTDTVFFIPERDLIPECIAYDPVKQWFFVGSIYKRKVLAIDKSGKIFNFIKPGSVNAVLGIRVDEKRRELWVISDDMKIIPTDKKTPRGPFSTEVLKYNIDNGKLLKRYSLDDTTVLMNDLTLAPNGDAYFTNTLSGSIYTISHTADALKLFLPAKTFNEPNGIALKNNDLFVADDSGVSKVDIRTKKIQKLATGSNASIGGIDGLYFYKDNRLIGVQNGAKLVKIVDVTLDQAHQKVVRINKLVEGKLRSKHFSPTTGTIVGDTFYYIVNAQVTSFNKDKIFPDSKLAPVVISKKKL